MSEKNSRRRQGMCKKLELSLKIGVLPLCAARSFKVKRASLVMAARVLRCKGIGALPITNGDSLAVIITRSDILDAFIARESRNQRFERRSLSMHIGKLPGHRGIGRDCR
jgi:CBS domain-containing protein